MNFCFFCPLPDELLPNLPPLLWLSELLLSLSVSLKFEKYDEVSELDSLLLFFLFLVFVGDGVSTCCADLVLSLAGVDVGAGLQGAAVAELVEADATRLSTSLADELGLPPDGEGVAVEFD